MRVVALANQKGGVGKTTVALLVALAMAHLKQKVLVVDLDPQANLTDSLLPDFDPTTMATLFDAWGAEDPAAMQATVVTSPWAPLDVVPGDVQLARVDDHQEIGGEQQLRYGLEGVDSYDWVFVDCPRALGPLTNAALVAAHGVLAVVEPTRDALHGMELLADTTKTIRRHYNKDLRSLGAVLNRLGRYRQDGVRADELAAQLGEGLWEPRLPQLVAAHNVREQRMSPFDPKVRGKKVELVAEVATAWAQRLLNEGTWHA